MINDKKGQIIYCLHENKNTSGICDKCLGKEIVYNLISYKGKFDIIQDKDLTDDMDVIVGEISHENAIKEMKWRVENALYYGIIALFTKNKELSELYNKYDSELRNTITPLSHRHDKITKEIKRAYEGKKEK